MGLPLQIQRVAEGSSEREDPILRQSHDAPAEPILGNHVEVIRVNHTIHRHAVGHIERDFARQVTIDSGYLCHDNVRALVKARGA